MRVQCVHCGFDATIHSTGNKTFQVIDCPTCGKDGMLIDYSTKRAHSQTIEPGYEPLAEVLQQALDQAQAGKGKERHANGKPFVDQPILEITRNVGDGYPVGQATKKLWESQRLGTDAAIAERLGAINYIAASIIRLREIQR
jgi:hypothetical protein